MNKKYRKYKKPNFFRRNFSFSGYMTSGEFWSEMGIRVISFLCAVILLSILIVVVVPGNTEELITVTEVAIPILAVFWAIPMVAMTRRRLRDGGFTAKTYLWLLLPAAGLIIFIVRLCAKSIEREQSAPLLYY